MTFFQERWALCPGGEGPAHLYKPYRYVPPQRLGFLYRFSLKTGVDFAHFDLESSMVFEGTKEVYERFIVSIPNGKERKRNM